MVVTGALKKGLRKVQEKLHSASVIEKEEEIMGVVEEVCFGGTLQKLKDILDTDEKSTRAVLVESVEMYEVIAGMGLHTFHEINAVVNTKFRTVDKKVKLTAGPLPAYSEKKKRKEV